MVDPTIRRDILDALTALREGAMAQAETSTPRGEVPALTQAQLLALTRRASGLDEAPIQRMHSAQPVPASETWWDPKDFLPGYSRAKEISEEEKARHRGWNNAEDAARHAEWSRRVSKEIGPFWAWAYGLGHEYEDWRDHDQPWDEALMDLHNNKEGRAAAREGRPIRPRSLRTNRNSSEGDY
jgi:hypothetical protein